MFADVVKDVSANDPTYLSLKREKAALRLQRAFRRNWYRFDRKQLVDRLRLESTLEVFGGRLVFIMLLLALVCINLSSTDVFTQSAKFNKVKTEISNKFSLSQFDGVSTYLTWDEYNVYINQVATTLSTDQVMLSTGLYPDTYLVGSSLLAVNQVAGDYCSDAGIEILGYAMNSFCPGCRNNRNPCTANLPPPSGFFVREMQQASVNVWSSDFSLNAVFYTPSSGIVTHIKLQITTYSDPPTVTFRQATIEPFSHTTFKITAYLGIVISGLVLLKDIFKGFFLLRSYIHDTKFRVNGRAIGGIFFSLFKLIRWLLINALTNILVVMFMIMRLSNLGQLQSDMSNYVPKIIGIGTDYETAYEHMEAVASSIKSDEYVESFGIIIVYELMCMTIYCLSGHPRVAVLTDTWKAATDEMLHFILSFIIFFTSQGVIGWLCFAGEIYVFRNLGASLTFLYEITWSGQWSVYYDPLIYSYGISNTGLMMFYLVVFCVLIRIVLINFVTAILVETYMQVREKVASTLFSQSLLLDAIDTVKTKLLVSSKLLPSRPEVAGELVKVFAKRVVDIDQLKQLGDIEEIQPINEKPTKISRAFSDGTKRLFDKKSLMLFCRNYHKYAFLTPGDLAEDVEPYQLVSAELALLKIMHSKSLEGSLGSAESTQSRLYSLDKKIKRITKALNIKSPDTKSLAQSILKKSASTIIREETSFDATKE